MLSSCDARDYTVAKVYATRAYRIFEALPMPPSSPGPLRHGRVASDPRRGIRDFRRSFVAVHTRRRRRAIVRTVARALIVFHVLYVTIKIDRLDKLQVTGWRGWVGCRSVHVPLVSPATLEKRIRASPPGISSLLFNIMT